MGKRLFHLSALAEIYFAHYNTARKSECREQTGICILNANA